MILYVLSFFLSFFLSLYITPKIRDIALRFNIVDVPDQGLKRHKEPVAYLGGMAVYISFLVTLALTFKFERDILALLLGGSVVFIIGVIDDLKAITPRLKLIGQCLAILAIMKTGIMIELTFIPIWLSIPLSFLWLLSITNAFNLIDIMDGLSSGVAFVICIFLFLVATFNGRTMIAVMTLSLGGSILGFLKSNFYPANIYLGDAGSLFIGLMLGALAMIGSYTDKNIVSALAPVLILGVPIFDTLFVSYIRFRRGESIFRGSDDHYALRLRKISLSVVQVVVISYIISVLLGLTAVWMLCLTNRGAFYVFLGFCIVLLAFAWLLKKIDMTRI